MKIFSSVSAVLLSEVAITSPLRAHRGGLVAKQHNHIASCPSIETVRGTREAFARPSSDRVLILFSDLRQKKRRRSATSQRESGIHSCIAATLATRSRTKSPSTCADRLYFRSQTLKIKFTSKRPGIKPVEGGANMDELIGRLASKAGIDSAVAEKPSASFWVFSVTRDLPTRFRL